MKEKLLKKSFTLGCVRWRLLLKSLILTLLIFTIHLNANAQAGTISRSYVNESVENVFKDLQRSSNFRFVYVSEDIKQLKPVTHKFENATVIQVVEYCLKDSELAYEIDGSSIVIKPKGETEGSVPEKNERVKISGKVVNEDGEPLPGATVIETGTFNGTTTNSDGIYNLILERPNSAIQISYIGFDKKEIPVENRTTIDITLQSSNSNLDEVVVIGYGTSREESVGSAISYIKAKEIEEKSIGATSIEQIIGGQIKGIQVSQSSGAPGAEAIIRVRGITSPFVGNGNNQPLYVVDGVAFNVDAQFDIGSSYNYFGETQSPLSSLNPDNIESFTVLKDAAATAIYGSRGANGVILITTKRGRKKSQLQTTLNYSLSISNPSKAVDVLDTDGFKALHTMIAKNTLEAYAAGTASYASYLRAALVIDPTSGELQENITDMSTGTSYPVFGDADMDWQKEVMRQNAPTHQWNLSLNGGDEKTNFYFGLFYTNQEPIMIKSYYKKYGTNFNIDSDVSSWLKIGGSISYSGSNNIGASNSPSALQITRPDYGIYDENGDYLRTPNLIFPLMPGFTRILSTAASPVAKLLGENTINSTSFLGNSYAEATLFKGFKLRSDINVGVSKSRNRNFQPLVASMIIPNSTKSSLTNGVAENYNSSLNLQANYHRVFDKNDILLMAGTSWDRANYYRFSVQFEDLPDDYILTNASSAAEYDYSADGKATSGINSFYSRIQYTYNQKYAATVNFRRDKSSKFGPGKKVAYFPSLALNWNIHKEAFMENMDFMDKLILRTSYGKTGSANVSDFAFLQYFSTGSSQYREYESGNVTIVPNSVYPNSDLHWESTQEFNVGLDFSLFSNLLSASLDIYDKETSGVLIASPLPLESGASSYTSNLADISNKGWELGIGANIIQTKDFNWNLNFNIATNHNKVLNVEGNTLPSYMSDYYTVGQPIGIIKGYRVEKIIQTMDEIEALNEASPTGLYYKSTTAPGDYLFKDINGDKTITADDKEVIGSTEPDFFGGFNMMLSYKRMSLTSSFQYATGVQSYWLYSSLVYVTDLFSNGSPDALTDTWTPDNTDAAFPRLIYGDTSNKYTNDAVMQNTSYLRCKSLRLNYQMPEDLLQKVYLKSATLYMAATNLFTLTSFKGSDPEEGSSSILTNAYHNTDPYPYSRMFSFGVKVGF